MSDKSKRFDHDEIVFFKYSDKPFRVIRQVGDCLYRLECLQGRTIVANHSELTDKKPLPRFKIGDRVRWNYSTIDHEWFYGTVVGEVVVIDEHILMCGIECDGHSGGSSFRALRSVKMLELVRKDAEWKTQ